MAVTEKIKSVLLVLLVALSLFQTYQLWYGQKPADMIVEDVFEEIAIEGPRRLTEVITPRAIIIHLEPAQTEEAGDEAPPGPEPGDTPAAEPGELMPVSDVESIAYETDHGEAELDEAELDEAELDEAELDEAEPDEAEPDEAEPDEAELDELEPGEADPGESEHDEPDLNGIVYEEIVQKELLLLQSGEESFNQLWSNLSQLLRLIDPELSPDSIPPPGESKVCLAFHFSPPLPVGNDMPWLPGLPPLNLAEIELHCSGRSSWLVLKETAGAPGLNLPLPPPREGQLRLAAERAAAEEHDIYKALTAEMLESTFDRPVHLTRDIPVPSDGIKMDHLIIVPEQLDRDTLLKTFFVDYNLARVIDERGGGRLYTDGEKGLRIRRSGFEYSHPILEEGFTSLTYREALDVSNNLISYHGGWPDSLHLDKLSLAGKSPALHYEAEWIVYHDGYPLYTGFPTRAYFNDRGLFNLTRSLYTVFSTSGEEAGAKEIAGWREALVGALEVFDTRPGQAMDPTLEAMSLGYAITGSEYSARGTPTWLVRLSGENIYLEAYNLAQIQEEDLL